MRPAGDALPRNAPALAARCPAADLANLRSVVRGAVAAELARAEPLPPPALESEPARAQTFSDPATTTR